jgi:anaerobic ribonucleoside-triphosphate reductase
MEYVIKRNGTKVPFDKSKIVNAIEKAMTNVPNGIDSRVSNAIADHIADIPNTLSVEQIQDIIINSLQDSPFKDVAEAYSQWRQYRQEIRDKEKTNASILEILDAQNDAINQENSNKNATINSTQRDYMAGEVSKELTDRLLLPKDIRDAHRNGLIHVHDKDYFVMHCHNCDLVNLEDMLQNGTVISGTYIEKPHSFSTACNIATQIIAQVASMQFGGQSITLSHLAPFVDVSRKKIAGEVHQEFYEMIQNNEINKMPEPETVNRIVEERLHKEIARGVQTIQYQVVTLMTTNGQAPFITVFMYLDEVPEGQTRDDLALIIEEVLKQRIQGVKNEVGVWVTPAFPKLIYVLEEDNIHPDSKYYYLTEFAAKCTAKRMVPDYISAKVMKELKGGVWPSMGCVEGKEVVAYRVSGKTYIESIERMWERLMPRYKPMIQSNREKDYYIDLYNVDIYDNVSGWTECKRLIKNVDCKVLRIKFSNGRCLDCTPDHPFETQNRGVVRADELAEDDIIKIDKTSNYVDGTEDYDENIAWLYGLLLCDSSYQKTLTVSLAAEGEDDIIYKFRKIMKDYYGLETHVKLQERGKKGTNNDVTVLSDGKGTSIRFCDMLATLFGGLVKMNRHIPSEVFAWKKDARMAFMAGMIDADGYINSSENTTCVQIGSTNKELAIQQMMLAQSLGMRASVYQNHYNGAGHGDAIRFHVAFVPTQELINYVVCCKKKEHYDGYIRKNTSYCDFDYCQITSRIELEKSRSTYDVTTASEHFMVSGIYSHNCRSFLTPDRTTENVANAKNWAKGHKYYGRFNQGVVTINLVDVACSSEGDRDKFWKIFDERLELCHRALQIRHKRLLGTPSDMAPILWQYGALARLKKGEKIDKLLFGGYSTISLGYAGLYECVKYMTGESHTAPEAKPFALEIMQHMNDKCNEWKTAENIDYSIYGTPLESTTYEFARCLQKRFGIIPDVTDHDYITNSYHVVVREHIDAFTKLKFESEFQKLSPGGAISYVEVPNMQQNIPAVISVIKFIYDNIMYAELNTKSDYCQCCGYDGEIKIVEDEESHKLVWECPNCGNRDQNKMNVVRRTCGYLGTNFWNQGRTQEIRDRVVHLSDN